MTTWRSASTPAKRSSPSSGRDKPAVASARTNCSPPFHDAVQASGILEITQTTEFPWSAGCFFPRYRFRRERDPPAAAGQNVPDLHRNDLAFSKTILARQVQVCSARDIALTAELFT